MNDLDAEVTNECKEKKRGKGFETFTEAPGLLNTNGLWNAKMKVFPKNLSSAPTELAGIKNLKEEIFLLRIKLSKLNKSQPWTDNDLDKVVTSLKTNK